jgi:hypothetical protein
MEIVGMISLTEKQVEIVTPWLYAANFSYNYMILHCFNIVELVIGHHLRFLFSTVQYNDTDTLLK